MRSGNWIKVMFILSFPSMALKLAFAQSPPHSVWRQPDQVTGSVAIGAFDVRSPNDIDNRSLPQAQSNGVVVRVPEMNIMARETMQTSPELTLPHLESIALSQNPSIAQALARVQAAQGRRLQAGLYPNPEVGYSGQQMFSSGKAEQFGLFVGQEIVRGGKLNLNRAIIEQEIQRAQQEYTAQTTRVLTDVRQAYFRILVAQKRSQTTGLLVTIALQGQATVEALVRAKEVSQADVLRARLELQTAQLSVKTADTMTKAAWAQMAAVLGGSDMQPQPLAGSIEDILSDFDEQQALSQILSSSPEIAAALTDIDRARRVLDRARAEPIPNLNTQSIVQYDNATSGANASFQITVPVPWSNRNQGAIRAAQAELIAAQHALERLELSLRKRLSVIYQRYAAARRQAEDYSKDEGILSTAKSSLDLIRQAYQLGSNSYLDVLTAQRAVAQANMAYVEALGELWSAQIEMDGLLLSDSLDEKR